MAGGNKGRLPRGIYFTRLVYVSTCMCVVAVVMHYCTVSPSRSSRAKYRLSLSPGVQYCNGGEERENQKYLWEWKKFFAWASVNELRAKVFTVLNHEDIFYSQYWRGLSYIKLRLTKYAKLFQQNNFIQREERGEGERFKTLECCSLILLHSHISASKWSLQAASGDGTSYSTSNTANDSYNEKY